MVSNDRLKLLQDLWIASRFTKAETKAFNRFYKELLAVAESKAHFYFPTKDWKTISSDAASNLVARYLKDESFRYAAFRHVLILNIKRIALDPSASNYDKYITVSPDPTVLSQTSAFLAPTSSSYEEDAVEDILTNHPLGVFVVADISLARTKKDLSKRLLRYLSPGWIRRHITPISIIYSATRKQYGKTTRTTA